MFLSLVLSLFLDKYSNKRKAAENTKGRGKGGKGEKGKQSSSTEITVGSQVCLSTAPLYQVIFLFLLLFLYISTTNYNPYINPLPPFNFCPLFIMFFMLSRLKLKEKVALLFNISMKLGPK